MKQTKGERNDRSTFTNKGKDVRIIHTAPTPHNHVPGLASGHLTKSIAILWMPKCASSAVRKHTRGWVKSRLGDVTRKFNQVCVILRDPYERFISALNMYTSSRPITSDFISLDADRGTFSTHDEHFLPQSFFLEHLTDFSKIDFFYMKTNVLQHVSDYYNLNWDHTEYQYGKDHDYYQIVKSVDEDMIRDIYKQDYELIQNTKFIN
jgi:hypothetical protein